MAFTVQMPALGESVTEGTVTRWLKQEGDRVEVDEPLLEVSTDKVDTEIPSPAAGVLERIVAGEDETVEVGGDLAVIGDGDGGGPAGRTARPSSRPPRRLPRTRRTPSLRGGSDGAPQYPNQAAEPAADAGSDTAQDAGTSGKSGGSGTSGGSGGSGTPVTMPELGESVTEGTVTRWLKHVGDTVEVDEPLLEVSTDKVDTEIPSPVAGTLLSITVGEDETVQVGAELAVVGDPGQASQDEGGSSDAPDAGRGGRPSRRLPRRRLRSRRPPSRRPPKQDAPEQETDAEPERAAAGDGASDDGEAATTARRVPRT